MVRSRARRASPPFRGNAPGKRSLHPFGKLAKAAAQATGSFWAFTIALLVVVGWAVTGPLFGFSDTWQLAINTATTIVTFLMVFLIQHAQNRDTRALQLKLDELIASVDGASNQLISIEDLDDEDLEVLHDRFQRIAKRVQQSKPSKG